MRRGFLSVLNDAATQFVGKTIDVLFGKRGGSRDVQVAVNLDRNLERDISLEWADLLREHTGRVEAYSLQPRATHFDYTMARVIFPDLDIRITRGRGELSVDVAPGGDYGVFADLGDVLRQVSPDTRLVRIDSSLSEMALVLSQHWQHIVESFPPRRIVQPRPFVR